MDQPTIEMLARRVEHVERENRRLRRIMVAASAGAILALLGAARFREKPRIIEAERFMLYDKDGRIRALLDMTPDDTPTLAFYDKQGSNRARFIQLQDGSMGLSIFDKDEVQQLGMGVTKEGQPALSMDKDGKRRLGIGINPDGSVVVGIQDEAQKPVVTLEQLPEGIAGLRVFVDGDHRIGLGVSPTEGAALGFERAGVRHAGLGISPSGSGSLRLMNRGDGAFIELLDKDGKTRLTAGIEKNGRPDLKLIGQDGQTLMETPKP